MQNDVFHTYKRNGWAASWDLEFLGAAPVVAKKTHWCQEEARLRDGKLIASRHSETGALHFSPLLAPRLMRRAKQGQHQPVRGQDACADRQGFTNQMYS